MFKVVNQFLNLHIITAPEIDSTKISMPRPLRAILLDRTPAIIVMIPSATL
jgi:hypothetical protein